MPKKDRVPRVVVSGEAPASVLCELRRMGREWFTVERVAPSQYVAPETLALLRYWRDDTSAITGCMNSEATTAVLSRDQDAAVAIELTGTPLVLVNEVIMRRTPDRLQMDSLVRVRLVR